METKDILSHILPKEFVEYFELVKIEDSNNKLIIHLDEKLEKPPEHSDKELESKGFGSPVLIQDFPIRDHQVLLRVRIRKWKDKNSGKVYSRNLELKHTGTSYTKEFALFLKKIYRH